MARIFHSIRQRLLKENRLTRYMGYAIGEILLVVIGILIALQVNNWNEGRKLKDHAQKLHLELYDELVKNHIYLEGNGTSLSKYIIYLESIISNWDSLDFEVMKQTIPNEYAKENLTFLFYLTNYSQFYDPEHEMYTKALNEGSISLVNKDFVSVLSGLYQSTNSRINQFIGEEYKLSQEINKYISETYPAVFQAGSRTSKHDWDDATYSTFVEQIRQDGVLRYKFETRMQQMAVREHIIASLVSMCNREIRKHNPKIQAQSKAGE